MSLTGPLNSGNGIVGGILAPLGLYLVWIFAVSVWWLRSGQTTPSAGHRGNGGPPTTSTAAVGAEAATGELSSTASSSAASSSTGSFSGGGSSGGDGPSS